MVVYNLLVRLYGLLIRITSINNMKAKQWVDGRKNWKKNLELKLQALTSEKRIWVHCASYGEFEQGRPLIEAIKLKHPEYIIILSFFSPSGYEPFQHWNGADVICYLPLDTVHNSKEFIRLIKPKAAIFIKYEFWVNYLTHLRKAQIPTFLVSAVFKEHHPFFKWYGGLFRRSLKTFTELFIQDERSAELLTNIGVNNFEICGDTRFDRVLEVKKNFNALPMIDDYCKNHRIIIGGSTWPKDNELLISVFEMLKDSKLKLILVPHNVDAKSIQSLETTLDKNNLSYNLYSNGQLSPEKNILIVDTIGLLSRLYHYADVSYVGGGFNAGIHNCLEPAVYFKPVVFYGGEEYHKYNEAIELLEIGAAKNVRNVSETYEAFNLFLNDKQSISKAEIALSDYFRKKSGTTERVMSFINWT